MTTSVKEALSLDDTKRLLIEELTQYSRQYNGRLRGDAVVTCFKNVVCLEMRSSISALPTSLWNTYNIASEGPDSLFNLEVLVSAISKVRDH